MTIKAISIGGYSLNNIGSKISSEMKSSSNSIDAIGDMDLNKLASMSGTSLDLGSKSQSMPFDIAGVDLNVVKDLFSNLGTSITKIKG